MKKLIPILLIGLLTVSVSFGQSKKDLENTVAEMQAKLDSVSGIYQLLNMDRDSLSAVFDSVRGVLSDHKVMYDAIKEKVLPFDFDPLKFGEIIDSLQSGRDSLIAGIMGGSDRLRDTIHNMVNLVDSLSAEVASLKEENEKLTFFVTQIKGEMGIEEIAPKKEDVVKPDAVEGTIPTGAAITDDVIKELKKWKQLLDAGIITQEEFDAKKNAVLD